MRSGVEIGSSESDVIQEVTPERPQDAAPHDTRCRAPPAGGRPATDRESLYGISRHVDDAQSWVRPNGERVGGDSHKLSNQPLLRRAYAEPAGRRIRQRELDARADRDR